MADGKIPTYSGNTNFRPNPDVLWRRLDDEVILMQLKTDRMFSLNRTGARFWELMAEGLALDEVTERLKREFEVSPAQLSGEIAKILDLLNGEQLIAREEL